MELGSVIIILMQGSAKRLYIVRHSSCIFIDRNVEAMHKGTAWSGAPSPADLYDATFFKIREISLTYSLPHLYNIRR